MSFAGNFANATGGAIYSYGDLSIQNNDAVLFNKNVEKSGSTYRLRSIYAGGSGDVILLSSAAGKSIEFRDSVYIASGSTVNLNVDYTYLNEEGTSVTVAQKGDIIFTGAATVDDLYDVKGDVAGTEEEIRLSHTTEVNALTNLYGGRLRVEEGAIYKGYGITAHEGSGALVRMQNATLSHNGYNITFNAGSTLELAGTNSISGNVQMREGSILSFDGTETQGMTWLIGNLNFTGGANISLGSGSDWSGESEILLFLEGALSGWDEETLSIRHGESNTADIRWMNGDLLVLNYNKETFKPWFRGDIAFTTQQTGNPKLKYYNSVRYENINTHSCGGAIAGDDITLSHNGSVEFCGNTASSNSSSTYGGTIYGCDITLSDNGSVEFCGNTVSSNEVYGGAIYGYNNATIMLGNNGSVMFTGNTATASIYSSNGGAIYGDSCSTISLSNNGRVEFVGNAASAFGDCADSYACGGAISAGTDSIITLKDNGSVKFSNNSVFVESYHAEALGGAIYGGDKSFIVLNDNGCVLFENNMVSAIAEHIVDAYGGAICAGLYHSVLSSLSICNHCHPIEVTKDDKNGVLQLCRLHS